MTVLNVNAVSNSNTFGSRYFYYNTLAAEAGTFAQWRACAVAGSQNIGNMLGTNPYYADFLYNQMNHTGVGWQWNVSTAFSFDTSSLPDDAVISAATFSLCRRDADVGAKSDGIGSSALGVTGFNPATQTSWVKGDKNNYTGTRYATDVPWASIGADGTYTDWTFNASGIAAISKTGYTNVAVRINWDIDNSDPGGSTSRQTICGWQTGNTGQTNPPKLSVTYTVPTAQNNAPIVAIFMAQK